MDIERTNLTERGVPNTTPKLENQKKTSKRKIEDIAPTNSASIPSLSIKRVKVTTTEESHCPLLLLDNPLLIRINSFLAVNDAKNFTHVLSGDKQFNLAPDDLLIEFAKDLGFKVPKVEMPTIEQKLEKITAEASNQSDTAAVADLSKTYVSEFKKEFDALVEKKVIPDHQNIADLSRCYLLRDVNDKIEWKSSVNKLKHLHTDDLFEIFQKPEIYKSTKVLTFLLKHKDKFVIATSQTQSENRTYAGKKALSTALDQNNVSICQLLLDNGADCTAESTQFKKNILHFAASNNAPGLFRKALNLPGIKINHKDWEGKTPLLVVCARGDFDSYLQLMKHKPDTQIKDNNGYTALHCAAYSGNLDLVKATLSYISKDEETKEKLTPLFIAIKEGKKELVEFLLSIEVNLLHRDKDDNSALYTAVNAKNNEEIISILLIENQKRIELLENVKTNRQKLELHKNWINNRSKSGKTTLFCSLMSAQFKVAEILLSYKANPFITSNDNESAIYAAAFWGKVDYVNKWLTERPEFVNRSTVAADYTPLMATVLNEKTDDETKLKMTTCLLKHGAFTPTQNELKLCAISSPAIAALLIPLIPQEQIQTTFQVCIRSVKSVNILEDLKKRGADPNAPNVDGERPLNWVRRQEMKVNEKCLLIKELLRLGADPHISYSTEDPYQTDARLALSRDPIEIVQLLLSVPPPNAEASKSYLFKAVSDVKNLPILKNLVEAIGLENINKASFIIRKRSIIQMTLCYENQENEEKRLVIQELLRLGVNPHISYSADLYHTDAMVALLADTIEIAQLLHNIPTPNIDFTYNYLIKAVKNTKNISLLKIFVKQIGAKNINNGSFGKPNQSFIEYILASTLGKVDKRHMIEELTRLGITPSRTGQQNTPETTQRLKEIGIDYLT